MLLQLSLSQIIFHQHCKSFKFKLQGTWMFKRVRAERGDEKGLGGGQF